MPWLLLLSLSAQAREAPWQGTINEAFSAAKAADHRWAGPFTLDGLARRFGGHVDTDLNALPAEGLNLLYGDPSTHPALARVLAWHHIALDAEGVTLGRTRLRLPDPFLIAALPLPGHPERPVLVYTAWSATAQTGLNRIFHGPTPLVVGSHDVDTPHTAYAGPIALDDEGRLDHLRSGAPRMSATEALEDLRTLLHQLDQGWAGIEGLDATLQAQGSSWAAKQAEAEAALSAKAELEWSEVHEVLRSLLRAVQDSHFSLQGQVITEEGQVTSVRDTFVHRLRPCFVDGRLVEEGGLWSLDGAPVSSPPAPVPGPKEVQEGVVYRFPTLLRDGQPASLIGLFSAEETCPATLPFAGQARALHRPRGAFQGDWAPWGLEEGPVPVLAVRTMQREQLDGMPATARSLRSAERLILDLRMNGGGADQPAYDWVNGLQAGPYRWAPGANLRAGDAPRDQRWRQWGERTHRGWRRRAGFSGLLYVLTDNDIYSSGETFVQLAAQVPGARVVGLNTAGCVRYGNISSHAPLPHTGLVATFGHTTFDWSAIRPEVEGVGIFPDVWLDEADPVAFLTQLGQP
jgi:hypothetical protein